MVACESATIAGKKFVLLISFVLLIFNSTVVVDVLISVIVVAIGNDGVVVSEVTGI